MKLPICEHLPEEDQISVIHASDASLPENQLANEVCYGAASSSSIRGPAYVAYERRAFNAIPDWDALHSACYEAKLKAGPSTGVQDKLDTKAVAGLFMDRRAAVSATEDTVMDQEDNGEDGWEDEEVEKPRESKDADSDDNEEDNEEGDSEEDEDEDSNASYEDESELESDEDDDPRKKALLDMIKQSITKDGKLDLERYAFAMSSPSRVADTNFRLGLVERNGKLVPK